MVETGKLEDTLAGWMDRHPTPRLAAVIVVDSKTTFACDAGVITFRETASGTVLEFQQTMQARRVLG